MIVEVRLPGVLAPEAGGARAIAVPVDDDATVAMLLDALSARHPALGRRIRDETGQLRRYVNLFLGEEDVRTCGGTGALVPPGVVVSVLPSVAGG